MCYGTARTMCRTRAYAHYTRTFTRDARARFFLLSLPSSIFAFSFLLFPYIDLSPLVSLSLSLSCPYLASLSLSLSST